MEGPMKNLFDPAGKVALVTGGTSGLGHAIAEAFLQNGVDVAVCSRHPESAPELAELAAAEGRRYLPVYCDITKEEDVEKMGDIIEKELGPVTMLVNSAGMNILKHAEDYDAESFNKVMSLNVLGTHNVSKMCGKRWMIPAHKGRIVNLSSAKAFLGTDRDYSRGQVDNAALVGGDHPALAAHLGQRHCADLRRDPHQRRPPVRPRILQLAGQAHPLRTSGHRQRYGRRSPLPLQRGLRVYHWCYPQSGWRRDLYAVISA